MKNWLVPALFAALLQFPVVANGVGSTNPSGTLSPIVTVPPEKSWLACRNDAQCSATALSCHGWIAINAAHEAEVQRWYSRENADFLSVVECAGPSLPKPETICRRRTCRLK